jgi:hypothetical protein
MVSTSELRGGSEIGNSICYNKSWGKQLYRQICRELQWWRYALSCKILVKELLIFSDALA